MSPLIPYRGTGSRDSYIYASPDHRGKLVSTPEPKGSARSLSKPRTSEIFNSTDYYTSDAYKRKVARGAATARRRQQYNEKTMRYGATFQGHVRVRHPDQEEDLFNTPCGAHKSPRAMATLKEATLRSLRDTQKHGRKTLATNPGTTVRHLPSPPPARDSPGPSPKSSSPLLTPNGYHTIDGVSPRSSASQSPRVRRAAPKSQFTLDLANLSPNGSTVRRAHAPVTPKRSPVKPGLSTPFNELPAIKPVRSVSSKEWLRRSRREQNLAR